MRRPPIILPAYVSRAIGRMKAANAARDRHQPCCMIAHSIKHTPRGAGCCSVAQKNVKKTSGAQNAWCYVTCSILRVESIENMSLNYNWRYCCSISLHFAHCYRSMLLQMMGFAHPLLLVLVVSSAGPFGLYDLSEQKHHFRSFKSFPSCCVQVHRHLVAALLTSGECSKIFCLVRAADAHSAQRRVEEVPAAINCPKFWMLEFG